MDRKQEAIKEIKIAMDHPYCDKQAIRVWLKQYEKVAKRAEAAEDEYYTCLLNAQTVQEYGQQIEQYMQRKTVQSHEKDLRMYSKEMKRMQSAIAHEFLISSTNQEFFSTYQSLIGLFNQPLTDAKKLLILQSEVENLLALLAEGLELAQPDFYALGYFRLEHKDSELSELPAPEKYRRIGEPYEREFLGPIRRVLGGIMQEEHVEQLIKVLTGGEEACR